MNTEILEGNKLIAEFMGCTLKTTNYVTPKGSKYTFPKNNNEECHQNNLRYNLSWDWLMPVVEKIESISAGLYHSFSVRIQDEYCGIHCHEKNRQSGIIYQTPYGTNQESKIIATWDAVVSFIKWYNLNQPTH